ncbi:HigA family addiction module antitoxin [Thalassospira xiamenensis]|uniref:HigA family addiction module antitoxin n=1 Tax=Thalassospira xiamenensis TaxID=220697 RepID=UPI000DEE10B6|nr:HigA family addiction module antitoxin [Thalassospira xiamenensis]RCK37248.1 XRE family transcriptional regulator [Thalassospira xiamenensis]
MRTPIHPGEILKDELDGLDMSGADLAREIHVPVNRITEILRGRRNISADTAIRLGRFFGSSAKFWLNLQSAFELRSAEAELMPDIDSIQPLKIAIAAG